MRYYMGRGIGSRGRREPRATTGERGCVEAAVKFIREGGCSVYAEQRQSFRGLADLTHQITYIKGELERVRTRREPANTTFLCLAVNHEIKQDLQTMLMSDGIMINGNGFSAEFAMSRPMWLTGPQLDAEWLDNELRYLWLVYADHTIETMMERYSRQQDMERG